jgi:non-homologous end joining protein Ku
VGTAQIELKGNKRWVMIRPRQTGEMAVLLELNFVELVRLASNRRSRKR